MSSESTPSSSLAPANLSTITSSFFSILQNRNIIHIVCEVVIIGITSYYFYKKTNTLSNQIKILEAKIEQLENESKKQKVFLDEKLAEIISAVNSHMMSQMYQPQYQHIQSSPQPQHQKRLLSLHRLLLHNRSLNLLLLYHNLLKINKILNLYKINHKHLNSLTMRSKFLFLLVQQLHLLN